MLGYYGGACAPAPTNPTVDPQTCRDSCRQVARDYYQNAKDTICTKAAYPVANDRLLCRFLYRGNFHDMMSCCFKTTCYYNWP